MTSEKIAELISGIRENVSIPRTPYLPLWNPIEEFIHYVSPKEICHSRILSQFLDPKGPHGDGTIYLSQFLYVNGIRDYTDGTPGLQDAIVTTERSISNGRKIDIFIEWEEPSGQKRAVIIENKLNGACYQPNQLEDYRKAIVKEGYTDVKVISLHINEKPQDSSVMADSIMYASDIAVDIFDYLLGEECIPLDYKHIGSIFPYENYLLSLSINNATMDIAKQILDLDNTTLTTLATLVRAFSKLNEAKNLWLLENLRQSFPDISYEIGALEGDEQISFWRKDDFERNGCWVCVHYPKRPENDEQGTAIWLVSYPENKEQAETIAAKLGFVFSGVGKYKKGQAANWFREPGDNALSFFSEKHELLKRITDILTVLSD
ncbi:PD-(D/E)XK nuclease family protein [Bacteroides caecimuris]|uniref:PD-(D/E)XK nuclease family protein n=2 Tax=Bacteroides TaxID=816 RepID=UPI0026494298|nr:PD-(D/E)XK nuclease family protein [Bacteroides caecimuris]